MSATSVQVLRAADRFVTRTDGVETWHCFSFGEHYDPANTSYGPLVAVNDTVLQPGAGFTPHRHVGIEIVTWLVAGVLHHEDSTGHRGDIGPGVVQRLSAGPGVVHTEAAGPEVGSHPASSVTRFVQMWLTPDEPVGRPEYSQQAVDAPALASGLVVVASGRGRHRDSPGVRIRCAGAALLAGRLTPGQSVRLPPAELVFVYVARGVVATDTGQDLASGDSARLAGSMDMSISGLEAAEVLVWEMDAAGRGR